jgi:hypothetical protein
MKTDIFIITNGRSTFKYALESAEKQKSDVRIVVIENMKWVDALNRCLELCQSEFYLRQDDDMFIHPLCVKYLLYKARKTINIGAYICKLWEDWSGRPGGYIKLYNTAATRKVGFKANKLGKVDKPFFKKMSKTKYRAIKDDSLVGLHACGTIEDEENYRKLWLNQNAKVYYDEPRYLANSRKKYKKTVLEQYELLKTLMNKNKNTPFYKFRKK